MGKMNIEQIIIGTIVSDKDAMIKVSGIIIPEHFENLTARLIYTASVQLYNESFPIDLLTLNDRCSRIDPGVDAMSYIIDAQIESAGIWNVEHHGRLLLQKYIRRQLTKLANDLLRNAADATKDENALMADTEAALASLNAATLNGDVRSLYAVSKEAEATIKAITTKGGITGIDTGFRELNYITSGWQRSDLIIIAARPGMGKSAFSLSLAKHAAAHRHHAVIFSLEMTSEQIATRLIASNTNIEARKLRNADITASEWGQITTAVRNTEHIPIFLDDTAGISVNEIRTKCLRLKRVAKLDLVIIDYLQLMTLRDSKNKNREQEISTISRSLKALAKELNIPVIALSQLSRAVESRGDKRPQLSDLRESGAIEQDADIVSFLFRPGYYDDTQDDTSAEVIISKNRNGALQTVYLNFDGPRFNFTEPKVSFNRPRVEEFDVF
jgi:replicative DNA helicase